MAEIDKLSGFVPAPRVKRQVEAAIEHRHQPFMLRQVVEATGLPKFIVHRVLSRMVRQGTLRRWKVPMSYAWFDKGRREWRPGGRQRRVYIYSKRAGE